jgi:hypothetical protein
MGLLRKLFASLVGCESVGHVPDRTRVRHDNGDLRTVCARCYVEMVRYGHGDWREDTSEPGSPPP